MSAALVNVAIAVAADLANGHLVDAAGIAITTSGQPARLSQQVLVERVYIPRFKPPQQAAGQFQVIVSTEGESPTRNSRGSIAVEYTVQIGVCGKVADVDDVAALDAAMLLLQQLGDFFFDYGLTGNPAIWTRNDVLAWPDREMLSEDGVLFALWNAVFEGSRGRAGA